MVPGVPLGFNSPLYLKLVESATKSCLPLAPIIKVLAIVGLSPVILYPITVFPLPVVIPRPVPYPRNVLLDPVVTLSPAPIPIPTL